MQGDHAPSTAAVPRMALIDGLRGLAAIGVLLYHYMHFAMSGTDHSRYTHYLALQPARWLLAPFYDYGFYAVQLFWIISGFVFAAVYFDRAVTGRAFAVNRLARLYPLHLLTLLVVAALQALALARLGHTLLYDNFDLRHFLLQLVFASDWVEGSGHSFNGPVWSVSVEVLVYGLFWLLRAPLQRMSAAGLLAVIGFCLLASAFGTVTRVPLCAFYFFIGTALWRLHGWLGSRRWHRGGVVPGLLVLAAGGLAQGSAMALEVIAIPALACAMLLVLVEREETASRRLRRAASWLGDCTYGIYLWHVPLQLALMLVLLPAFDPGAVAAQGWFLPVWLGTVIAVARLSYVRFELPMRQRLRALDASGRAPRAVAG